MYMYESGSLMRRKRQENGNFYCGIHRSGSGPRHSRCLVSIFGEGRDGCAQADRPLHSPPLAAAPTGCLEQAGNQEGAGRCPQGLECPWTPGRLSLPALSSGPGGYGAGMRCHQPHHQGRMRRWRHCRHSCGQKPRPPHPRLHSAPPGVPAWETGPGTGAATPQNRAGKGDAGDVSRKGGQERLGSQGSCSAPSSLSAPWPSPHLDLLNQLLCPQQFRLQLLYLLLHGQYNLSKLL